MTSSFKIFQVSSLYLSYYLHISLLLWNSFSMFFVGGGGDGSGVVVFVLLFCINNINVVFNIISIQMITLQ